MNEEHTMDPDEYFVLTDRANVRKVLDCDDPVESLAHLAALTLATLGPEGT